MLSKGTACSFGIAMAEGSIWRTIRGLDFSWVKRGVELAHKSRVTSSEPSQMFHAHCSTIYPAFQISKEIFALEVITNHLLFYTQANTPQKVLFLILDTDFWVYKDHLLKVDNIFLGEGQRLCRCKPRSQDRFGPKWFFFFLNLTV